MADDGMLLNFSVPSGPIVPKTILRGGPWRERRRIALKQKQRSQDSQTTVPLEETSRLPKRQKLVAERSNFQHRSPAQRFDHHDRPDRPVISSLFSSNPESHIVFKDAELTSQEETKPSNAPLTSDQLTFTSLGLSPKLAVHLTDKLSITAPTAIQKAALPALLKNDTDLFIQAQTGSGKTLAYLLPIVNHILDLEHGSEQISRDSGLFALILAPTRELCKQIWAVLESLLRFTSKIVAGNVMGGEKKKSEKARLRKGMNILVATPGRLADHLQHTKVLDLSSVRWLVLDEGDRLMELGFEDDIKKITSLLDFRIKNPKSDGLVQSLPTRRTNVLCSATMRGDVERLGELSLKDAQHITPSEEQTEPGTANANFTVPAQLKQQYLIVPAKLRLVTLHAVLKKSFTRCTEQTRVIVFFSCAHSVDFHFRVFSRTDEEMKIPEANEASKFQAPATELTTSRPAPSVSANLKVTVFRWHGSLTQAIRTSTLSAFSTCTGPAVLLSTDIASRGLDLPHVDRVIEYDPAFSREEHLHRVGRTARAGKDGHASIFLMPGCEEGYVEVLKSERDAGESGLNLKGVPADSILRTIFNDVTQATKEKPLFLEHPNMKHWEQMATDFQLNVERWALDSQIVLESARKAYQSHIRAYATHVKEERNWFDFQELHLGHLAKSFGLRDRPGSVNVPGMRASAGKVKADRKKAGGGSRSNDTGPSAEFKASRSKMVRMGRMGATADEFNLA